MMPTDNVGTLCSKILQSARSIDAISSDIVLTDNQKKVVNFLRLVKPVVDLGYEHRNDQRLQNAIKSAWIYAHDNASVETLKKLAVPLQHLASYCDSCPDGLEGGILVFNAEIALLNAGGFGKKIDAMRQLYILNALDGPFARFDSYEIVEGRLLLQKVLSELNLPSDQWAPRAIEMLYTALGVNKIIGIGQDKRVSEPAIDPTISARLVEKAEAYGSDQDFKKGLLYLYDQYAQTANNEAFKTFLLGETGYQDLLLPPEEF